MTVSAIGTAIVSALTSGLTLIPTVASSIIEGFTGLFFTGSGENQTLSAFAIVMLVFGGVALAFGISRLVMNLIRSKVGK